MISNNSEESDHVIGAHTSTSRPRFGTVWFNSLLAAIHGDLEETKMMFKEPTAASGYQQQYISAASAGINVCRDIVRIHKI
jgi:hypothetical protein